MHFLEWIVNEIIYFVSYRLFNFKWWHVQYDLKDQICYRLACLLILSEVDVLFSLINW